MLDRPHVEQMRVALVVLAASGFLVCMGWLTASERHGLTGLVLWAFCYGLPAAVLFGWLQAYVRARALRLRTRERTRSMLAPRLRL